jgi:uncharacterized protein (TIGR02246 family)
MPPRYQRAGTLNSVPAVPAMSPEKVAAAFAAAINAGDVSAALDLWSEQAMIVRPDGEAVRGRAAVEGVLQTLIGNGTSVEIDVQRIYEAADVAVALGTLKVSTAAQGLLAEASSVVVYARAPDGSWRVAIDAPWGLPPTV